MKHLTALLVLCMVLIVVGASPVLAQSVGVDPASGSFNNDFDLDVTIDTDTESIAGIGLSVQYDQNRVTFSGYDEGDVPCDPLTVTNDTVNGEVEINCLMDLAAPTSGSYTGSGILANLQFNPISTGSLAIVVEVTDDGGVTFTTANGSYTITGTGGGTLPNTGAVWNKVLLAGLLLITIGGLWVWQGERWMRVVLGTRWFEGRLGSKL